MNCGDIAPLSFPRLPRIPISRLFRCSEIQSRSASLPIGRADADIGGGATQVEPCVQFTQGDSRADMAKCTVTVTPWTMAPASSMESGWSAALLDCSARRCGARTYVGEHHVEPLRPVRGAAARYLLTRRVVARGGNPNGPDGARRRSRCCGGDRSTRGQAQLAQHKSGDRRVLTDLREPGSGIDRGLA